MCLSGYHVRTININALIFMKRSRSLAFIIQAHTEIQRTRPYWTEWRNVFTFYEIVKKDKMRFQTYLLRTYNIFLRKISSKQLTRSERDKYSARIFDIKRQLEAVNVDDMTAAGFEYYKECCDIIAELELYYG